MDILAQAFPDATPNGSGWRAKCPSHKGDSANSLSIAPGENGRILLHCFGGCSPEAVCAAVGLKLADLMPPKSNGATSNGHHAQVTPVAPKPKGKAYPTLEAAIEDAERKTGGALAGKWEYHNAEGELVGVCARFNVATPPGENQRKEFRPFHCEGETWFMTAPEQWPLYNTPDLLAADPDAAIYVSEGEKCADSLAAVGVVSLSWAGGCKGMPRTDWTPLRNRRVIILADNDDEGREGACKVAALLTSQGCRVRIVNNLPDLPPKGDIADLLDADGAWSCRDDADIRSTLEALAAAAPEWTPQADDSSRTSSGGMNGKARAPVLINLGDVSPEPIQWCWPGVIVSRGLTGVVGDPGQGKSLLMVDLAARISRGDPWPDSPGRYTAPGGVLFITAEDPLSSIVRPRLDAAGADPQRIIALDAISVRGPDGAPVELSFTLEDVDAIEAAIVATPDCKVVFIDPISAFMGSADSNNNSETRALLRPLAKLAERRGVAVVLVSHLRKHEGAALHRTLGSIGFIAACRTAWGIARDKDDPDTFRRLMLPLKNNYAPDRRGFGYRIVPPTLGEQPRLEWEPNRVDIDADALMSGGCSRPGPDADENDRACRWLRAALADGAKPADDMLEEATKGEGIAKRTLDRARRAVGVKAFREKIPGPWYWRLTPSIGSKTQHCQPLLYLAILAILATLKVAKLRSKNHAF